MALTDIPTSYGTGRIRNLISTSRICGFGDSWFGLTNARMGKSGPIGLVRQAGELTAVNVSTVGVTAWASPFKIPNGTPVSSDDGNYAAWTGATGGPVTYSAVNRVMQYYPAGLAAGGNNRIYRSRIETSNPMGTTLGNASVGGAITRASTDGVGCRVVFLAPPSVIDEQANAVWRDSAAGSADRGSLLCRTAVRPSLAGGTPGVSAAIAPRLGRLNAAPYDWTTTPTRSTLQGDAMLILATNGLNDEDPEIHIALPADEFVGGVQVRGFTHYSTVMYRCNQTSRVPTKGMYWCPLIHDNSWGFGSLSTNQAPTSGTPKFYTNQQLLDCVDMTTIDVEQENIVLPFFATESSTADGQRDIFIAMMARHDRIYAELGLRPPHYLLIGNPYHKRDQDDDITDSETHIENQNRGAYAAALTHPRAVFISLAKRTGGFYHFADALTGLTGNEAAAKAWMADQGYTRWVPNQAGVQDLTAIVNGSSQYTIWDDAGLHPRTDAVSIWFAWLLREEIDYPSADAELIDAVRGQSPRGRLNN